MGDKMKNLVASKYQKRIYPLYRDASHFCDRGIAEMDAYEMLYDHHRPNFSDFEVKAAITVAYSNSNEVREAMYWKDKGRQYCPSKSELDCGEFHCPRCKTELKKTIYKKWTKLYACPDCLFLIAPGDILDSMGQDEQEEAAEQYGWDPVIKDPSEAFNEWL